MHVLQYLSFFICILFPYSACYFCALVTCYSGDIEEIRWKYGTGSTYQKAQKARARYKQNLNNSNIIIRENYGKVY